MDKKKLLAIIEQVAKGGWIKLNLMLRNITELPPEIGQLQNLTTLDLYGNQLSTLPPEIGQLQNLIKLGLIKNQLSTLPPEIGQLQNLMELDLRENQLSTLPPEIGQLRNLTQLDLTENQLSTLPPEIGQLQKLTQLDLSNHQLSALPPEIGQLQHLTKLDLRKNQLSALPPEIGQLRNLTQLDLTENQLSTLPPEIGQLRNLTHIYLRRNQLRTLPSEIGQLRKLVHLDLRDNKIPNLPPEILKQYFDGVQEIIAYYLKTLEGEKKLNEAKVILVGDGTVGKTSLVQRMLYRRFDAHQQQTDGIIIKRAKFTRNNTKLKANLWDFGGQEIMHATHQFFLTKRSLYLLVLDARQGDNQGRIEYWLKLIHGFGGDSPVLIVINKIDQNNLDINRRGLQEKYPAVLGFFRVSCRDNIGIQALMAQLRKHISELKHISDVLPESWFKIKQKLEKIDRDYMPYGDYQNLCKKNGIPEPKEQKSLIGLLHDLGVVLNFQDDPRLKDTNVLNPEWVTQGIYKLLMGLSRRDENKSLLDMRHIGNWLPADRYPSSTHRFIKDMMLKFELCFSLGDEQRYLIPELLSKEQPKLNPALKQNALSFQYHYDVLPTSVMSRLIVKTHELSTQYWFSGVVLKYQDNRALVISDPEEKLMYIWISGYEQTRREFLAIIRQRFDAIHQSIKGIAPVEKVEFEGVVLGYEELKIYEQEGENSLFIPQLRRHVDVGQLLDGFVDRSVRQAEQRHKDDREQAIHYHSHNHEGDYFEGNQKMSDKRINVSGGTLKNVALSSGNKNQISQQFQENVGPVMNLEEIRGEFAKLRELLAGLELAEPKKVERALEDAGDELQKPEPDKSEVADALDRALKVAGKTGDVLKTVQDKIVPFGKNIGAWLGQHGETLMNSIRGLGG